MRSLAAVVLLAGCDQLFNLDHLPTPPDAPGTDATDAADAAETTSDAIPNCYGKNGANGAGLARICFDAPARSLWTGNATVDTSGTGNVCDLVVPQAGGVDLCVITAESVVVTGPVATRGSRPLAIVATGTMVIGSAGSISVASRRGAVAGAGSNDPSCPTPTPGATGGTSGGGGAGGSFGETGGSGGSGADAGGGGASGAAPEPAHVRGGCRGAAGGGNSTGNGTGGGALYLIAGTSIAVNGLIDASGEGGPGGAARSGGGGGGSGGLVGFDAPQIEFTVAARVVANGGGGGSGGNAETGEPGHSSALGEPYPYPARGGAKPGVGGGGDGGMAGQPALNGSNGEDSAIGGGGGGGGVGMVRSYAGSLTLSSGNITPPLKSY